MIVGLGQTGLSCARYLSALGERIAITDSRAEPPGLAALTHELPAVEVRLGQLDEALLGRADRIVVSPGVSLREPAIAAAAAHGVEVLGDVELFARAVRAPVVVITGSNGKSTVTTLVGEMARAAGLSVAVGGNLGTPALALLTDPEPALYVLELSSFQLETTVSLNAVAATVLNISPDHMDRYVDLADYTAAKERAYRGDGVMVLNADDAAVYGMRQAGRSTSCFSIADADCAYRLATQAGTEWLVVNGEPLLSVATLGISGRHNHANALAAMALADAIDLPPAVQRSVLETFCGLPHRTQRVAEQDGVVWYNDSKGTNVGAALAAIAGLGRPVVLIAGGLGKGQDFTPLRAALARHGRAAVLIGRDAPLIEAALAGAVPCVHAPDMEAAVMQARTLAQRGDAVLLSPACASFDMFENYQHRGALFVAAVRGALV